MILRFQYVQILNERYFVTNCTILAIRYAVLLTYLSRTRIQSQTHSIFSANPFK